MISHFALNLMIFFLITNLKVNQTQRSENNYTSMNLFEKLYMLDIFFCRPGQNEDLIHDV